MSMASTNTNKKQQAQTYSSTVEKDNEICVEEKSPSRDGSAFIRMNGINAQGKQLTGGLTSKQATLYLSRASSLMRPDIDPRTSTPNEYSSVARNTRRRGSSPKKTATVSIQREFTFTGYDIMTDTEPTPMESTLEQRNVKCYNSSCRAIGINPVNYIAKHINDKDFVMKNHSIGPHGARALCVALVNNSHVETIDLEENNIGTDGAESIANMLKENDTITEVRISENLIGSRGASAFTKLLKQGKYLHTLDISGSDLEDSAATHVAGMIEFSKHLRILNVSHNRLCEIGTIDIGRAIAINDTLIELDLSWNHIRGKGALAVAMGLKKNVGLRTLNLSWNGFAKDGSIRLGRSLVHNRTLKSLDVSNNRMGADGVGGLIKGLKQNEGLSTLKIGRNPISSEVALTILKAIHDSDKCVLTVLDLSDIVVRPSFLDKWDEIKSKRSIPLRIMFGAIMQAVEQPIIDGVSIDWRDPVMRLFKYFQDKGYRLVDLLKRLDKDRSLSVNRQEFKLGLLSEHVPMTEAQLDEVIKRLDVDGDGEVDLGELIKGEKEFRRKMKLRMKRMMQQTSDPAMLKLMQIAEL